MPQSRASFRTSLLVAIGCLVAFPDCVCAFRVTEKSQLSLNATRKELAGDNSRPAPLIPIAVVQAASAIHTLWVGSTTVLSIRNIYIAMEMYKQRKGINKDLEDAFVRSRIIALEEAHKHEKDAQAMADIFSADSLSGLRTFADTTERIAGMCKKDEVMCGKVACNKILQKHADDAEQVYDDMRGKVCRGLASEVEVQAKKAHAVAQTYWKTVPGFGHKDAWRKTLYYEVANKRYKVYWRDPMNEFDYGVPNDDQIHHDSYESECQPRDLDKCSADSKDASGEPYSDSKSDKAADFGPYTPEFDNATGQVKLLLQGMEDADCPEYKFDACARQSIICTYGARNMLETLEMEWKKERDAKRAEIEEAKKRDQERQAGTNTSVTKSTHWFWRHLTWFQENKVVQNAWVPGIANLIGAIAQWLYKWRQSIWKLLNGKGLETWALKQVWTLLWTNGIRNQGFFLKRYLGDWALDKLGGKLTAALPGMAVGAIPQMAKFLHAFSWMAINRAKAVDITEACQNAAEALQTGEFDSHVSKAEERATASLPTEEEEDDGPDATLAAHNAY